MSKMKDLRWACKVYTAPAAEPLTAAEVKAHLRIESSETADDTYIGNLITAARTHVENYTSRQLISATWDLMLDEFPEEFIVPRPPLVSVTSLKYYDTSGVQQTLSSSYYSLDTTAEPGVVYLSYGYSWPGIRAIRNTVQLRYVCGYGAAGSSIPYPLRQAMLQLISDCYEFRERTLVGTTMTMTPMCAELLAPYVIPPYDA